MNSIELNLLLLFKTLFFFRFNNIQIVMSLLYLCIAKIIFCNLRHFINPNKAAVSFMLIKWNWNDLIFGEGFFRDRLDYLREAL